MQIHICFCITSAFEGISEEHLTHVFEKFYKVDKSRNSSGGDSGLGLYIAKENIVGMGGTISVESILGEGTTFIISLVAKKDC